ncbi:hypothetical protein L1987_65467 [Smallanthus sonchifolius]|uniref:Uncharacterized protein n=1 Tax=Smallanthus sonchifolius TaxID=185202 RepID=A0ACB9BUI4_9ASTR|nr:hypothetical protein L1987_65467 [Smallanthus sonchifolius]
MEAENGSGIASPTSILCDATKKAQKTNEFHEDDDDGVYNDDVIDFSSLVGNDGVDKVVAEKEQNVVIDDEGDGYVVTIQDDVSGESSFDLDLNAANVYDYEEIVEKEVYLANEGFGKKKDPKYQLE